MPTALAVFASLAGILLIGNLLILCHELGHFTGARVLSIHGNQFTIGFGPPLIRRTSRHSTIRSLGIFFLGRYVGFAAESDTADRN